MTGLLLPLGLRVAGRRCTVVGGDAVALRHAKALRDAGATVTVQAEIFHPTRADWDHQNFSLIAGTYAGFDPQSSPFLVIAATHEPAMDAKVACGARAVGALVSCVDDPASSDFALFTTEARGDLVGSTTPSPSLTRQGTISQSSPSESTKRHRACVSRPRAHKRAPVLLSPRPANTHLCLVHPPGVVSLIGAGPGASDLLTVRAVERLATADVVIHDELVQNEVLWQYAPLAHHLNVGKRKGHPSFAQGHINQLIVDYARHGLSVVRLKGGDPCLFGRAEEERRAILAAGLSCEIIPGISALSSVPAAAGLIVTNREHARSLGAFSLHKRDGEPPPEAEWKQMAEGPDTLVLFMGRTVLELACQKLIDYGRSPDTPAVLIIDGTRPGQRVVRGTLETLPEHAATLTTNGPGLIVIGEVCRDTGETKQSFELLQSKANAAPGVARAPLLTATAARPWADRPRTERTRSR